PNEDVDVGTTASLRAFVTTNREHLDAARRALNLPSLVPVKYTIAMDHTAMTELRSLSRAFWAESKLAVSEGRLTDAARIDLETMQLGYRIAPGGLYVDDLVGRAVEAGGMMRLSAQINVLEAEDCRQFIHVLETNEASREPFGRIQSRE